MPNPPTPLHPTIAEPPPEESWSQIVSRAIDDISRIMQSEVRLLEASLRKVLVEQVDRILASVTAAVILIAGGVCMIAALILLLHLWFALWLSWGITGGVLFIVALIVWAMGRPGSS
jgi:Putative Actinobacterial Holin-X, holin superfamily III